MATITITAQVELTADDLAAMGAKVWELLAGARVMGTETPTTAPVKVETNSAMKVATAAEPLAAAVGVMLSPVGPVVPVKKVTAAPAKRGAVVAPPTKVAEVEAAEVSSKSIRFEEFDQLVRKEMKRLSMDGRLPGHKLWNDQRQAPLPTLGAVMLRYECKSLEDLAAKLGYQAPLRNFKLMAPTATGVQEEPETAMA